MNFTFLHHKKIEQTGCPECKAGTFPITQFKMYYYFHKHEIKCSKCGVAIDWWKALLSHFNFGLPSFLFPLIGGQETIFRIELFANGAFEIDLEKVNIPHDAKILDIHYSPREGNIIPTELNRSGIHRHIIPSKYFLYGVPYNNFVGKVEVDIFVSWIKQQSNNKLAEMLVIALEEFNVLNYRDCVIPANVVIEETLNNLLTKYLNKSIGLDKIKDFLSNGASYSHQLNVLLPLICEFEKFPKLPEEILGELNSLRKLRNIVAHSGNSDKEITKETVSRLICASIFGLAYLELFQLHIDKRLPKF